jgi:Flp pilus assembly protein TadG
MIFQSHNQLGKPTMALRRRVCDLRTCSAGVVAAVTAIVLPVLLGFTSLGVEVGHWYLAQRQMQGAADAAAISAAAQYIVDYNAGNVASLTYQTVGANYASLNGFTIPSANVCLVISSGDNCSPVLSLDSRAIICAHKPCVVVEITQNTALWSTTQKSVQPTGLIGKVQAIPTPTLFARAIVSAKSTTTTTTTNGTDCILALANDTQAVLVHGNGDLKANCGVSVDGGRDQNVNGTPVGGITFSGAHAKINVSALTIAGPPSSTVCPDDGTHCQQFGSSTKLPASAVFTNTATADPYAASLNFPTPPSGVQTGGVAIKTAGSGYTNGTCTFTVVGGTPYVSGTTTPAKFTVTITNGKVDTTKPITVLDPGAYTGFPTNPISATDTCGGSGATFNLTEGCFTWSGTAIAGRKYCSIGLSSITLTFPAGNYYIAGGDANCGGFCSSGNVNAISAPAGVTFFLTNGEGTGTYGTTSYATVTINGNGTLALCAPGTVASGKVCDGRSTQCTGTCMLFVQNPATTAAATTINAFNGTANSVLSGLIYLPKETFQASGNGTVGGCFGVIAKYIDVGGTPTFSDGCLPGHGIGGTTTTSTAFSTPYLYQ